MVRGELKVKTDSTPRQWNSEIQRPLTASTIALSAEMHQMTPDFRGFHKIPQMQYGDCMENIFIII